MTYEVYDQEMHKLFETALNIRANADSTINDLYAADNSIDDALSLCAEMETTNTDDAFKYEIINNRLRCYIERLATYTRLLKMAYDTPEFNTISQRQEQLCKQYLNVYSHVVNNEEVSKSQYQLTMMAYQSLAANYFRRGGMGLNKELCQQAINLIDTAIDFVNGNSIYTIVLQNNKSQIISAIGQAQ